MLCLPYSFFHVARFPARIKDGAWVPLEKQDRTLWRQEFIQQGFYYLQKVDRHKTALNSYYLQALISAMHCHAKTYEQTDWEIIVMLYSDLERMHPQSLLIKLNSIIAKTNQRPDSQHIDEVLLLEPQVTQANIFIYTMTKAYLYMKNKEYELSKLNYEIALQHTKNQADIKYILQQLRTMWFNDVDVTD